MAIYKLGELFKIKTGTTPSTKNKELWKSELNWYSVPDIINNTHTERMISYNSTKNRVPKNSILLTATATIGEVLVNKKECWHSQQIASFNSINKNIILNKFFYFWLIKNKEYINNFASGSAFKSISNNILKEIKIFNIPSIEEQQKIIDIIEPLEKQNMVIKKIIKIISLIIKKSPIKHNESISINNISNIVNKKSINGLEQFSNKMIKSQSLIINGFESYDKYKSKTKLVDKNLLLINTLGPSNKKFCIMPKKVNMAGELAIFDVKNEHRNNLLSALLNDRFWFNAISRTKGTTLQRIKLEDLISIKINEIKVKIDNIFEIISNFNLILLKNKEIINKMINLLI